MNGFVFSTHIFDIKLTLDEYMAANAEKNTFSASWRKDSSHLEFCVRNNEKTKAGKQ